MTFTLIAVRTLPVAALLIALAGCSSAVGGGAPGEGFGADPTPEIVVENGCIVPDEFTVVEFAELPAGFELLPEPDCVYGYSDTPGAGVTTVYLDATRDEIEAAIATDELWYSIGDGSWVDDRTNSTITIRDDVSGTPYGWNEGEVLVVQLGPAE